jgi:Bacterial Ig-like domain (group 3)/FG-GAP-like repeat
MKRVYLVCLSLCLTTTFSAQSQHPLSGPQSAQSDFGPRFELQGALPLPNPGSFGRGEPLRRARFSPWNEHSGAFPRNARRAGTLANSLSDPIFLEAPTYGSGGQYAGSVAVADVNGDGKPDLVVANQCVNNNCDGGVSVLLGNGDGKFQAAVTYNPGGYDAYSVAVVDVNGDGKPDLVVTNLCADSSCTAGLVGVLLGKGDGTFQQVVSYSLSDRSYSVAVADVNRDGKPDLVVANYGGTVGALLGNGDGTFQPIVTYDAGGDQTFAVTVSDVNGDGNPDLLVANNCFSSTNCATGSVSVLLGNGDGKFQPAVTYNSGGYDAESVAVADVNVDGKPDLLVANASCLPLGACETGSVGVLLGNGDGTFQPVVTYNSGGFSGESVAVADVNADGKIDLLVANTCAADGSFNCITGSVGVLLGNGDGTFQAAVSYNSEGTGASSVVTADVNGDGKPDVLVANTCGNYGYSNCTTGSVGVLLNNGDGSFYAALNYSSGGSEPNSAAVADVNGDGKLDLVVANQDGSLSALLGNGDGKFQAAVTYSSGGAEAESVAVADMNGDGKPDLIVANQCNCESGDGSMGVLLGNGDGTFQAAVNYGLQSSPNSVAVADVNGDGKPDLVVASYGTLEVLLGNGDGSFQSPSENVTELDGQSVAVADVNGDGKLDLVVANHGDGTPNSGSVSVLLGNGDGTFQPVVTYSSGAIYTDAILVGDVNGDGKFDLVVASQYTNSAPFYGVVGVLLGNGDGTFQTAVNTSTPTPLEGVRQLALADFNGDGKLDLAVGAGNVLLLGNGDGTFQTPLALGAGGQGVSVGDFNRDGRPDLVVGGVTVLLNISRLSTTTSLVSSSNPSVSGKPVSFTATVSSSAVKPTGKVQFLNGTTVLATLTLSSGSARYTTSKLPIGANSITAVYEGNSNSRGSTSVPINQFVLVATMTTLLSSQNPSSSGDEVTFTAMVTGDVSAPPFGGTVAFMNGKTLIGTGVLSAGSANFATSALKVGTHVITASYSGDSTFGGSKSKPVKQVIEKASSHSTPLSRRGGESALLNARVPD